MAKIAGNTRNRTPFLSPTQQLQTPRDSILKINGFRNYQNKQIFSPNIEMKPGSMCSIAYPMPSDISSMPMYL